MSIGDHLEELRGCVARSLVALVLACVVCIWPAKFLLELIARPVILILKRYNQQSTFLQTSPVEALMVYVKVVLIFGLVIATPYILYQIWSFVAAGLYRHEQRWVTRLLPPSLGLFAAGVIFMYVFALPMSLNFLVWFGEWLPRPDANPTYLERKMLGMPDPQSVATRPGTGPLAGVPLLAEDPNGAAPGMLWVNVQDNQLKVRGVDKTLVLQLTPEADRGLVTTHFKLGEYLSFVLLLMLAFGAAFQMPLVVLFLIRSGIVPYATFREYRKIVIVVIVFIAGCLAPPDLMSHLLLSVPMWLLFELGMVLGRRAERRAATERAETAEQRV